MSAARASRATSRDAFEALAVGIRPRINIHFAVVPSRGDDVPSAPTQLTAWTANTSEWPGVDLTLNVRLQDGRVVDEEVERLGPGNIPAHMADTIPGDASGVWRVTFGDAASGAPLHELVDRAVLRYSDEREIARYERTVVYRKSAGGSQFSDIENEEQRI